MFTFEDYYQFFHDLHVSHPYSLSHLQQLLIQFVSFSASEGDIEQILVSLSAYRKFLLDVREGLYDSLDL